MTDHITPQEAQELLRGTIPGPWAAIHNHPYVSIVLSDDEDDIHAPVADITDGTDEPAVHANHELMAAAPTLARTLAADTLEYGVVDANGDIVWFPVDATVGTAEDARQDAVNYANSDQFFRLMCRRVSQPWEVTDE